MFQTLNPDSKRENTYLLHLFSKKLKLHKIPELSIKHHCYASPTKIHPPIEAHNTHTHTLPPSTAYISSKCRILLSPPRDFSINNITQSTIVAHADITK